MRSKSVSSGQQKPSFIEEARRRQIIDTAIGIIATRGLSQASLAEIAREAGCSKGVISYHFQGKEELIEEILNRLIGEPADFVKSRVDACKTAIEKLRAYVTANFEFMQAHRNHFVALVDLWGSRGWAEGRNRFNSEVYDPTRSYLSRILQNGRDSGELNELPLKTMSTVIRAAVDGVMLQWVCDPDSVDVDTCREEILQMIQVRVCAVGN